MSLIQGTEQTGWHHQSYLDYFKWSLFRALPPLLPWFLSSSSQSSNQVQLIQPSWFYHKKRGNSILGYYNKQGSLATINAKETTQLPSKGKGKFSHLFQGNLTTFTFTQSTTLSGRLYWLKENNP